MQLDILVEGVEGVKPIYLSKLKKSNIWYLYYRTNRGTKSRASCRTRYKSEALKFLSEFKKRLKEKASQPSITMSELRMKYLKIVERSHTKKSNRIIKITLNRFEKYIGSDTLASEITREKAEEFIFGIYSTSPYSADLLRRHLHACWEKMIAFGYLDSNPFRKLKLVLPKSIPAILSKDELNRLLEFEKNIMHSAIYAFGYYTGCRLGEITNFTWINIDLDNRQLHIRNTDDWTTKTKKERSIPISNVVYNLLIKLKKECEYVFHKNGKKFNSGRVSKSFKKCIRAAGLNERLKFHSLRHSFCSNLVKKNVSIFIVKELAGHQSVLTTQLYSHLENSDLKKAIEMLD